MKKTNVKLSIGAVLVIGLSGPAFAYHANPWMDDDDTVLAQYHDENQAKSEDTDGEDEMNGVMVRKARGKLEGMASDNSGLGDGTSSGPSDRQGGNGRH
ncbi:hypothetical protein [Celeribacter litoreus]|uniref:hypothetical protein n=1 Tax=Celeribacter litoreus TaxID=2876714 RepID=UPI001CC908B1|nr:hypothetical protein [Celeribacter litoreus]MCA0042770.1 hypothetical protein [Celeribacter litoreus]